jgi:hypothetical protein
MEGYWETQNVRDHLEDLDIGVRIIFNIIG